MNTNARSDSKENIFTIECKDVILREFLVTDLDDFYTLTWQPEVHVFLPGFNVSKEQRKDWFMNYEIPENRQFLHAVLKGEDIGEHRLRLGIVLKQTGEFIGWCYSGMKDELSPPNREISYAISKDHRDKGYTTQAAQGMINYLFGNTNVEVVSAKRIGPADVKEVAEYIHFQFTPDQIIENAQYEWIDIIGDRLFIKSNFAIDKNSNSVCLH
ncbi:GNAT family N-acetyltransferase [Bacillus sp. FJAT-27264]|uniref:GNAT family N-acetyltransferase n=1 Tax=Paenibacillus sp. (strain DSM 101736 / FJAT-27264) TaxID=1850362 RepID=UPI0009F1F205|nr:GNAT family N-acetyltransferase [Bacillus sp. FJAT-27264]